MISFDDPRVRKAVVVAVCLLVLYWVFCPNLNLDSVRKMVCGNEGFASENGPKPKMFDPKTGQLVEVPFNDPLVGDFNQILPNDFLDDGAGGMYSIQHNLCSRSCCDTQFPPPFKLEEDPFVAANRDKYSPSQYFCNNVYQDAGCLCMTNDQADFLESRGSNSGKCPNGKK